MTQLGKRLVSSAAILSVALSMIFIAPVWLFFLFIVVFLTIGFSEFLDMALKDALPAPRALLLLFALLLPLSMYWQRESLVLGAAVLLLFVLQFRPPLPANILRSTAVAIFGLIYAVWFPAHVLILREWNEGHAWVFYSVLLAKGGDTAAYFAGKAFGRHRLIPHVSPQKSVEGSVACFVASVVLSLLSWFYLPPVGWFHLLVIGAAVGVISQLGDLGESLLKRDAGIKDSGQVPGLGGILDVLDSMILTMPFVYYYVVIFVRVS